MNVYHFQTPPASYRQRVDVHYSSLPRQAFATTLSTASGSSGSSTGNGLTSTTDSNANLKRNVAFGKCLATLEKFVNAINLEAEAAVAEVSASTSLLATDDSSGVGNNKTGDGNGNGSKALPGMSSSMNALSLSSALGSNLSTLKRTSASAQNISSLSDEPSAAEQPLIDFGQEHQERATTEPPPGSTLSAAAELTSPRQEGPTEAASSPALDREFHQRSKSQTQPFSLSVDQLQTIERIRMGFSVPNLGSMALLSNPRHDVVRC